jgi:hypothetical protein
MQEPTGARWEGRTLVMLFTHQKRDFLKKSVVFQIIIYNFASEFQNDGLKKWLAKQY